MIGSALIRLAALVALCATGFAATPSRAQSWPVKPVKIVVPFSASGTADLLARVVADKLATAFGQLFVVEDRPGAGGIIGQESVARAAPDGYTMVISSLGSFVINPVFTPVPFDAFKDFTHIAYLGGQPVVLIVNKNSPYKSLAELLAYAKANPGAVTYATISVGSQTQLFNELLQRKAGVKMTHVPYRGANQIVNDVLGGHLTAGLVSLTATAGQLTSASVRGLAISTERRVPGYADVPTYVEQGFPDLIAATWFALSGPAGLPPDLVARLNAEVVKALHAPDVQARFEREAIDTKSLNAADFTAFFRAEMERWTPLAREVAAELKAAGDAPK